MRRRANEPGHLARCGFTLLEICVVILVIAVLLGILIPAVSAVRAKSLEYQSKNKVRDILLGLQLYADANRGAFPVCVFDPKHMEIDTWTGFHLKLMPFLDENYARNFWEVTKSTPTFSHPFLISPADPTLGYGVDEVGGPHGCLSSYPANAQVFHGRPSIHSSFRDGASQTVVIGERYAQHPGYQFHYDSNQSSPPLVPIPGNYHGPGRPCSFADGGIGSYHLFPDVFPVKSNSGNATKASVAGKTFQSRPAFNQIDSGICQTPHSAMITGFGDGSIRSLVPSIKEEVFWSLVTPSGGEAVSDD
jgi:prepilin-type N-terminal cleavage/methylation domain-containing protein